MKERRRARPGAGENWAGGIRLQTTNIVMIIIVTVTTVALLWGISMMMKDYRLVKERTDTHQICQMAAQEMMNASDYLTDQARTYSVTGERKFLDNYFNELEQNKRRDKALETLETHMPKTEAVESLRRALQESNALADRELYAFRLMTEGKGYDLKDFPRKLQQKKLTSLDRKYTAQEKMDKARSMMFDNAYQSEKLKITQSVEKCLEQMLKASEEGQTDSFALMERTMRLVILLIIVLLALFLLLVVLISRLVIRPLHANIDGIHNKTHLPLKGAYELQYMASIYNRMFDENREHQDRLAYDAVHDSLTGALNRAGFEERFQGCDKSSSALILIDVDEFKEINDNYGHSVGDLILKRVVALIHEHFRAEDHVCRIGGDEFAIIMLFADSAMAPQIREKIRCINERLQTPEGDLPKVSLSVGVAFGDRNDPTEDMFKDADAALYQVKEAGRNGIAFYGQPLS